MGVTSWGASPLDSLSSIRDARGSSFEKRRSRALLPSPPFRGEGSGVRGNPLSTFEAKLMRINAEGASPLTPSPSPQRGRGERDIRCANQILAPHPSPLIRSEASPRWFFMKPQLAANHTTIDEPASPSAPDESTWDQEQVPVVPLAEPPSSSDLPADDRNPVDVLADEVAGRFSYRA